MHCVTLFKATKQMSVTTRIGTLEFLASNSVHRCLENSISLKKNPFYLLMSF